MHNAIVIDSPVGHLALKAENGRLSACDWTDAPVTRHSDHPVLRNAASQLQEYFAKKRQTFDVPLAPLVGTAFQKAVWAQLRTIRYGQTCSYRDVAIAIDHAKAVRATGSANGKNPVSIIIPCHRVIASSGGLGGYAGGLDKKVYLLNLEAGKSA